MRFLHYLYAKIFGYFWLPCPVCGKKFGGHEARMLNPPLVIRLLDGQIITRSVCSGVCGLEAQEQNDRAGHKLPFRLVDKQEFARMYPDPSKEAK